MVMYDHQLYVGDSSEDQYSVNTDNGSVKWAVSARNNHQPQLGATVTDNFVIVGNYPALTLLNRQTGDKFNINIDDNNLNYFVSVPVWDEKNKSVYMVIDGDKSTSQLVAIDVDNKQVKWRLSIPGKAAGSIILAHDVIYISNYMQLMEVNAVSGSINWNVPIEPANRMDMVATADRVFISSTTDNTIKLYSVSRQTHEVEKMIDDYHSSSAAYLALDNNRIYLMTRASDSDYSWFTAYNIN